MTNFKNLTIIHKCSYKGNDYFLHEKSQKDFEEVQEKAGDDGEKLMLEMWAMMLCDEKGKLQNLSADDISDIPTGFRKDICDNMLALATGQKKS